MAGSPSDCSFPRKPRRSGHHGSRMSRTDSGFESRSHRPSVDTGRSSLSIDHSTLRNDQHTPNFPSADKLIQRLHEEVSKPPSMNDIPQPSTRRRSEGRRPSVVSSINSTSTTKPRRSRPSSHKSSRRTLIIHQSTRPELRGSQTMPPLPARDVDDVLALHHRSCSLFKSIPTTAPPASYAGFGPADSRFSPSGMGSASVVSLASSAHEPDDLYPHVQVPPTTIHWTSPGTRRREYEEIDRSCRGLRGLLSKMRPRWASAASQPSGFYDADDASDKCSVRRYRLDLPEAEDEQETADFEKKAGSTTSLNDKKKKPMKLGKRWGCF